MIKTNKKYGNIIHESGKIELKTEWWFNDMTELITDDDMGQPIWSVMTKHIYEAYYEAFCEEWDGFDEEE